MTDPDCIHAQLPPTCATCLLPTRCDAVSSINSDPLFAGSIPEVYDRYLVPLIFETYATDLAGRVGARSPRAVLEVAAGTGVVTRAMSEQLPATASITATDLNQPMVDHASARGTSRPVTWQAADALALPFSAAAFDTVVCQFGVMFFPDRAQAYAEFRRVLRPGGRLIFNVWDRIETNEFARAVSDGVAAVFPDDPPRFLARTPHGYHDEGTSRRTSGVPVSRGRQASMCSRRSAAGSGLSGHPDAARHRLHPLGLGSLAPDQAGHDHNSVECDGDRREDAAQLA
jgi:SAM-dependent methyltransferase